LFRQISRRGTAALGIFVFVVGEKGQSPMVPARADAHADKDKALEEEVARPLIVVVFTTNHFAVISTMDSLAADLIPCEQHKNKNQKKLRVLLENYCTQLTAAMNK
jgi:hypothetical protein